ncbi:hypothetical protein JJJ17_18615 [Paracoccus caeni]|uniref:Uncharacterized protein n=1 Tax=Paracoccus caeni TaxID=657651 RepID=A0A934SIX5_9RHOB|nr:hypothetical protein [Paracoccus caeni]MBK4217946.1 hypothetical protein [Paracoccus caeni]
MAISMTSTPIGVTEAASAAAHFTHTTISRAFSRFLGALASYIEAERDIEDVASFDPAFLDWHRDAETARDTVRARIDEIRAAVSTRAEDQPLKRMALLISALINSGSSAEFLSLQMSFKRHAKLFTCAGTDATARRVRQMLYTAGLRLDDLAGLSACVDPAEFDDPQANVGLTVPAPT